MKLVTRFLSILVAADLASRAMESPQTLGQILGVAQAGVTPRISPCLQLVHKKLVSYPSQAVSKLFDPLSMYGVISRHLFHTEYSVDVASGSAVLYLDVVIERYSSRITPARNNLIHMC